jgi:molecular chaperone GrpE (heat shock protein)
MMDRYLAQCADEAFKALLTDDDLKTRLDTASSQLSTPAKALIETAPSDVRHALAEVEKMRGENLRDRANAIRQAIESILEEHACQTRQRDA